MRKWDSLPEWPFPFLSLCMDVFSRASKLRSPAPPESHFDHKVYYITSNKQGLNGGKRQGRGNKTADSHDQIHDFHFPLAQQGFPLYSTGMVQALTNEFELRV